MHFQSQHLDVSNFWALHGLATNEYKVARVQLPTSCTTIISTVQCYVTMNMSPCKDLTCALQAAAISAYTCIGLTKKTYALPITRKLLIITPGAFFYADFGSQTHRHLHPLRTLDPHIIIILVAGVDWCKDVLSSNVAYNFEHFILYCLQLHAGEKQCITLCRDSL